MSPPKKARATNVTEEQKSFLVDMLQEKPELISGKFSSTFTNVVKRKLWEEIAVELNKDAEGPIKNRDEWKKWFQEWKSKTRKKKSDITLSMNKTGGGQSSAADLTEVEKKLMQIVPDATVNGSQEIFESGTSGAGCNDKSITPEEVNNIRYEELNDITTEELNGATHAEQNDYYDKEYLFDSDIITDDESDKDEEYYDAIEYFIPMKTESADTGRKSSQEKSTTRKRPCSSNNSSETPMNNLVDTAEKNF